MIWYIFLSSKLNLKLKINYFKKDNMMNFKINKKKLSKNNSDINKNNIYKSKCKNMRI